MDLSDKILGELSNSGINKEEFIKRINEKLNKFSGLITKEGAMHMAAMEFGIKMDNASNITKIRDVDPSLKRLNILGRVFRISPIREFVRASGSRGKVVNISLSDGTGYVRLPLWNDQADLVQSGMVVLGCAIQVSNVIVKENPFGEMEISLGKFSNIKLADDDYGFPSYGELNEMYFPLLPRRSLIRDVAIGDAEISGNIVQVFKGKFLYENLTEDNYLVISCIVDDGTGNIRVVFFRELANEVSGIDNQELKNLGIDDRYKLVSDNLLGKEIAVQGKIVKSIKFNRLEMVASSVKSLNVLEESKKLVDVIELIVDG